VISFVSFANINIRWIFNILSSIWRAHLETPQKMKFAIQWTALRVPGGNQVDGLPPARHQWVLFWIMFQCWKNIEQKSTRPQAKIHFPNNTELLTCLRFLIFPQWEPTNPKTMQKTQMRAQKLSRVLWLKSFISNGMPFGNKEDACFGSYNRIIYPSWNMGVCLFVLQGSVISIGIYVCQWAWMKNAWLSINIHKHHERSMDIHGCPQISLNMHGNLEVPLDIQWCPLVYGWVFINIHGYSWISLKTYWIYGSPFCFCRCPWIFRRMHGHLWMSKDEAFIGGTATCHPQVECCDQIVSPWLVGWIQTWFFYVLHFFNRKSDFHSFHGNAWWTVNLVPARELVEQEHSRWHFLRRTEILNFFKKNLKNVTLKKKLRLDRTLRLHWHFEI